MQTLKQLVTDVKRHQEEGLPLSYSTCQDLQFWLNKLFREVYSPTAIAQMELEDEARQAEIKAAKEQLLKERQSLWRRLRTMRLVIRLETK